MGLEWSIINNINPIQLIIVINLFSIIWLINTTIVEYILQEKKKKKNSSRTNIRFLFFFFSITFRKFFQKLFKFHFLKVIFRTSPRKCNKCGMKKKKKNPWIFNEFEFDENSSSCLKSCKSYQLIYLILPLSDSLSLSLIW